MKIGGVTVQEVIKKIIEMDEDARKLKEKAELDKINARKLVAEARENVHREYIERAKERAEKNAAMEQKAADEKWEQLCRKHDEISRNMEKRFSENCDEWTKTIVSNVLNQF